MECYNCGAKLGKGDICQNCGANVKIYKKIIMASNAYYNDALEKAAVRDLSGAIESLRTSLRFYKMNIDARNLLGLVYFETGEVVEALTEWVISKNYQPRDNAASRYLNEIQNNPSRLDTINQTIKKYNQALLYCRQDSRDLAIIQLKKVLSLNPKLVSGHQLLALLYIQAKKSLRNAGKIDANNTTTLRYLKEVNAGLRENNPKKQKNEDLISYQSGNETIIQPRYLKDNSAIGTIINMVIGIAIGAAITCFLIVPGVRREIQNQAKAEVLDANNAVASKNQSISSLEAQIEDLTSQITDAKNDEESSAGKVNTYEQLLQAYVAYTDAIFDEAANTYGVSSTLLKSIARAESNFNTSAVSSAGAVGIMQLMPATAASLGVTDSYDAYQNIMGGANLISQLLARYNGDTSLALAAYNAGSANVDKYGGIPPFSETQNYVQKVLSYMGSDTNTVASASTAETSEDVATTVSNFIAANNISQDTLEKLLTLLEVLNA